VGFSVAYTWSKLIDNSSEVFGVTETGAPQQTAVPSLFGGLTIDRGISSFDRTHRLVFTYVYELPFMKSQTGILGRILGGWQLSGVTEFQSGIPVNVTNGVDADGIGSNYNRPDFNPRGRPRTRAIPATAANTSVTGYINPDDDNQPIDPMEARYIGVPTGSGRTGNAGRNLERFPWINNWNANLQKEVRLTEQSSLQFRWEVYNVFNHPQYGYLGPSPFHPDPTGVARTVFTSPAGQFLDPRFDDGGGRVLRYQVRLVF
jgi:hypothetical protein